MILPSGLAHPVIMRIVADNDRIAASRALIDANGDFICSSWRLVTDGVHVLVALAIEQTAVEAEETDAVLIIDLEVLSRGG